MLDAETERAYLERIHESDDAQARSALLSSHIRLCLSIAGRYAGGTVRLEDLVAEGMVGLCEASERFDLERETRFATYAAWWVRARVRAFALRNRRVVAPPSTRAGRKVMGALTATQRTLTADLGRPATDEELAEALDVAASDVQTMRAALGAADVSLAPRADGRAMELASERPSPEEEVEREEHRSHARSSVARALRHLDERELEVVSRRYLEPDRETLATIGQSMGISRERVRQLEVRAKEKMRDALARVA